jgi:hypothetical protein
MEHYVNTILEAADMYIPYLLDFSKYQRQLENSSYESLENGLRSVLEVLRRKMYEFQLSLVVLFNAGGN